VLFSVEVLQSRFTGRACLSRWRPVACVAAALAFGVSGYSLPWDQVGFWALQIVSALPETVDDFAPGAGVGTVVAVRGGFSVGQETLSRTCTAHTLALPAGDAAASLVHFLLIRKQGVSGPL